MPIVHIHRLGDTTSPLTAWSAIQKDDGINFICLCHAKNNTLTDTLHRMCTDYVVDTHITRDNALHIFTEILEEINHNLNTLYLQHKKSDVSIFLGLLVDSHLHFSMFGTELTGIIVSEKNIEDILSDMDTGEGHFVYDSHGDIRENETLYIFAPKIDTHVIGNECSTLGHLPTTERLQLIGERIERSYTTDGMIISIGEEKEQVQKKENWNTWKIQSKRHPKVLMENMAQVSNNSIKKIQETFVTLSKETQNWVIISGIFLSVVLLYLVITSLIRSQYTIFVPQKYRDMVAEARVNLDDATRMIDQPENFWPAVTRVRDIIKEVKTADVLKVDVAQLENDIAVLEKAVNKVTSLRPEDYVNIYSFSQNTDSLPFSIHSYETKLSFVTKDKIIGPFSPGESPKEYPIPNGEKYTFSDVDSEWRVYLGTDKDKIYIFDKWVYNIQNIQQVGGWDKALDISIYNSNIYLLGADRKQIYKHRRQAENTYSGRSFVIADTQAKGIIDIDIDGSVWILSGTAENIGTEKILTAPKYERRAITINGLGINTFQNFNPETTKIYTGESYQEVYILADNRIWIFVPSSRRFSDVRFMTYIGQIDAPNTIITDIAIEQDGDVRKIYFGSPKSGIFSTKITVKDNKILILPSQ